MPQTADRSVLDAGLRQINAHREASEILYVGFQNVMM
jgi:hypothetical protein